MIARKLALLFGVNRDDRPYHAACRFDKLSRGSVLCLLNASFRKRFPQRHNSIFYAEIDYHGVHWGNTGRIIARWRRPVASRVALDLPYWAMRSAPYRLIHMAIEMACVRGRFVSVIDIMSCITVAKRQCCGLLKIKPSYNIVHHLYIMVARQQQ